VRFLASGMATATGGELVGPDVQVDGATIDSRAVRPGQLFVPVVAERDGHTFIDAALAAGASAYLTSRPPGAATAIVVGDTGAALLALGGEARRRLPDRVVGVTGSVGKTSVKDLLAAVLAQRWRVAASARSFNNELGVPLTLLDAPEGCEAAVVEMGARAPGDLRLLAAVARPTVAVVVRVALAHTATFRSLGAVADTKAELVESLDTDGVAVLNAADELVAAMAGRTRARTVLFGPGGDVTAAGVRLDAELRPTFRLRAEQGEAEVRLPVRGEHQVENALAAAAAGLACGVSLDDVAAGLGDAAPSPWRMELERSASGLTVLNDAYNANPTSTAAALRALAALPARRRIAFLGTMAELGDVSRHEHRAVAALAEGLGIEVVAVGEAAYGTEVVADVDAAVALVADLGADDAVLVKGSRVAGLERLAERLLEPRPGWRTTPAGRRPRRRRA
jgi:UDP-N-acetylmuramoyl-tripeptide--D-alanyl-D-alanine ligase